MTIDDANEILREFGIHNTDDSDRGDYLAFQIVKGVTSICDHNTCTPIDLDDLTEEDIQRLALEWLEATA